MTTVKPSDSSTQSADKKVKPRVEKIQVIHAAGDNPALSPLAGDAWLTADCLALLAQIAQPWAAKKRATVIILAHQLAAGEGYRQIFEQFSDQLCTSANWFGKWQHLPDIAAAFSACRAAAADSVAAETAGQIAAYRRQKAVSIAKYAASAPAALANVMANKAGTYKGADVIKAVQVLFEWDDPNTGASLKTNAGMSIEQSQAVSLADMTDSELAKIAGGDMPAGDSDNPIEAGE